MSYGSFDFVVLVAFVGLWLFAFPLCFRWYCCWMGFVVVFVRLCWVAGSSCALRLVLPILNVCRLVWVNVLRV